VTIKDGDAKAGLVRALGSASTVAVGNGRNDAPVLRETALAMAVLGPEGAAAAALREADVLCRSVTDALDLLLDGRLLAATLRP
jgi:soluble P-type ATPase